MQGRQCANVPGCSIVIPRTGKNSLHLKNAQVTGKALTTISGEFNAYDQRRKEFNVNLDSVTVLKSNHWWTRRVVPYRPCLRGFLFLKRFRTAPHNQLHGNFGKSMRVGDNYVHSMRLVACSAYRNRLFGMQAFT